MKQIIFIMTHLGSKWEDLIELLKRDPRIDEPPRREYILQHPDHLSQIIGQPHKSDNVASIWVVPILHNHQFGCSLLKHYKCIFLAKSFEDSRGGLTQFTEENAKAYYYFRLSRMRRYWALVPHCPWIEQIDEVVNYSEI
jgi:hypothetical protein